MLIKTNYPYLKRETVPVDDVEAWLNENPHRRAEALTGKVQTIDGPFGRTRDGMKKGRAEAIKALKKAKRTDWTDARRKAEKKRPLTEYAKVKKDLQGKLLKGKTVRATDFPGWVRRSLRTRMVRELRTVENMDILAIYDGRTAVAWVLAKQLNKKGL